MKYGYVRVNTTHRQIDKQLGALLEMGLDKSCIYINYDSDKDFNRKKKLISW